MVEAIFWGIVIGLNAILFTPNYLLHFYESHPLPFVSDLKKHRHLGLTISLNSDVFRFSVEVTLFLFLCRLFHLSQDGLWFGFCSVYLIFALFYLYEHSFHKIYQAQPNFYNDLKLMGNAISIGWFESKTKFFSFIAALLFSMWLLFNLVIWLKPKILIPNSNASVILMLGWLLFLAYSTMKNGVLMKHPQNHSQRFHFIIVEIISNLSRSIRVSERNDSNSGAKFKQERSIQIFAMDEKPNIHLLFVESYGKFFYSVPELQTRSYEFLKRRLQKLERIGFKSKSHFSESSTVSGQSWLTYSTMLYGFRIDSNASYEKYLRDPDFSSSDSLIRILQRQGYCHYHLNPIRPIKGIEVPFEHLDEFFAIDEWFLDADMNYEGIRYGFGECCPDQYALNYTLGKIKNKKNEPYLLFYLTKNSHTPFIHPEFVNDWKSLNTRSYDTHLHRGFFKPPKVRDYQSAIQYELETLTDYIVNNENKNDLYIIIGDHQPPLKVDRANPETPVHIISTNNRYLEHLDQYGFKDSLEDVTGSVKHEALYSIILRMLSSKTSLAYEPDGLQL